MAPRRRQRRRRRPAGSEGRLGRSRPPLGLAWRGQQERAAAAAPGCGLPNRFRIPRGRHRPAAGIVRRASPAATPDVRSAEARLPSPAPQPRSSPGTGKRELRAPAPAGSSCPFARWLARRPTPNFFYLSFNWLLFLRMNEISLLFPKSKHKLLGSEEVSAVLLVSLEIFSPQQRSFKRHLLASFYHISFPYFSSFLFSCLFFLTPNWRGDYKNKKEWNACGFFFFNSLSFQTLRTAPQNNI